MTTQEAGALPGATAEGDEAPSLPQEKRRFRAPTRAGWALIAAVVATVAVGAFLVRAVIVPGYMQPTTRTYGTKLGFPALLRRLGRPLPVRTATAKRGRIVRAYLGEGTMASDPVLVPMVPIGRILAVYAQPGDRVQKGQLLAELDGRKGQLAADAARLAFLSAESELKRVQIGSVIVLNREQPVQSAIDVQGLQNEVSLLRDETAMKDKLFEQGLYSRDKLLEEKRILAEAERALDTATLSLKVGASGKSESERIASNTMQQAVLEWQERLAELNDYKILAPADGIVDRVLVHAGEYNQASGSPAVVLAAGLWFEAYFDQTAIGDVAKDAPAEVHLAARPDVAFAGIVTNVDPIVSYGTGGPQTSRPIRPTGTDAPEWPVTFKVRIALPPDLNAGLAPGLTGFARVTVDREATTVPEPAMISMSAGSGLLFVVHDGKWEVRSARYGASYEGWLEVLSGATPGDDVIVEGQQVLEAGDAIHESPWQPPPASRP